MDNPFADDNDPDEETESTHEESSAVGLFSESVEDRNLDTSPVGQENANPQSANVKHTFADATSEETPTKVAAGIDEGVEAQPEDAESSNYSIPPREKATIHTRINRDDFPSDSLYGMRVKDTLIELGAKAQVRLTRRNHPSWPSLETIGEFMCPINGDPKFGRFFWHKFTHPTTGTAQCAVLFECVELCHKPHLYPGSLLDNIEEEMVAARMAAMEAVRLAKVAQKKSRKKKKGDKHDEADSDRHKKSSSSRTKSSSSRSKRSSSSKSRRSASEKTPVATDEDGNPVQSPRSSSRSSRSSRSKSRSSRSRSKHSSSRKDKETPGSSSRSSARKKSSSSRTTDRSTAGSSSRTSGTSSRTRSSKPGPDSGGTEGESQDTNAAAAAAAANVTPMSSRSSRSTTSTPSNPDHATRSTPQSGYVGKYLHARSISRVLL
eukprot:INCI2972.2.p1 GENE.INCI2972.2~~INCI2972.2.p1  ORF type:complete len:435 (-),score=86.48 INCI2972.2:304-1608(-)